MRIEPYRTLPALADAWRVEQPAERLRAVRAAAVRAREALLDDGPALGLAVKSLVTFPYPASYGFCGAARSPAPFAILTNRVFVVQFLDRAGARRTLVFEPTDPDRSQAAPFFAVQRKRYGDFVADHVMSRRHGSVQSHLAALGLGPADVDYLAFDHLHVQDLRPWVGPVGWFPRARLIVQRREWQVLRDPHPLQNEWYVQGASDGVSDDRVELLDGDLWLGKGVALLSTPGHTMGNMSLAVVTPSALWVASENGIAVESYAPESAQVSGLRGFARQRGLEVILNANTREASLDQYTSMILEKTLAGPSPVSPEFPAFLPTSELTPSRLSPGLQPTITHGEVTFGEIEPGPRPAASGRAASAG